MKSYIMFFNVASRWNARGSTWHIDMPDPFINEWIVGELDGGYVTQDFIDDGITVLSHHKDLNDAVASLRALVAACDLVVT